MILCPCCCVHCIIMVKLELYSGQGLHNSGASNFGDSKKKQCPYIVDLRSTHLEFHLSYSDFPLIIPPPRCYSTCALPLGFIATDNHGNCYAFSPTLSFSFMCPSHVVSGNSHAPLPHSHVPHTSLPSSGNHGQLLCCHAHLRQRCPRHSKREGEPTPSRSPSLYLPQCGRGRIRGERWWCQ